MKRIFDIIISFFGLLMFLPTMGLIAMSIKVVMGNPVIFSQNRVGRDGKLFLLYKFRSMTSDHKGNSITVMGEPRITPLGRLLRKYKLDELPELWNILKGDMSFVGPRPDVPEYMTKLVGEERIILRLRPGLTSPASLKYIDEEELVALTNDPQSYYNDVIWPDKVRMNLQYCKTRSFGDMTLIMITISKLFVSVLNVIGTMIKCKELCFIFI